MKTTCCSDALPRHTDLESPAERELLERLIDSCDPAGGDVLQAAVGGRFVAVLGNAGLGLASTLGAGPAPGDDDLAERMAGLNLAECRRWLFSPDPLRASLGLAALNASFPPPDKAGLASGTAQDWLLDQARGRKVVLVGEFPFGPDLEQAAAGLHLLELKPGASTLSRSEWQKALADCELLAISGTALLTGMMAFFLSSAPQAAVKVVLGPTTPLSPLLFQAGVTALAGNLVNDAESILAGIREDLPYKLLKRQGMEPVLWFAPGWSEDADQRP